LYSRVKRGNNLKIALKNGGVLLKKDDLFEK